MRRLLLPFLVAAFSLAVVTWAAASGSSGREGKPDGSEHHEKKSDKDGDKKDKSRHDGDDDDKGSKPKKDDGHRDDKDGDRDDKDEGDRDDKDGDRDDDDGDDRDDKDDDGDRDDKDDDDDRDDGDDDRDDDDGDGPGGTTPPNTPGQPGTSGTPGPSTPGQPARPTTQPAAPQQPVLLVQGTSRRKCASVRSFRIRVRENSRQRLRWARVQVNGKTVKVVRGDRLRARVNLTGLPKGRFSVRIVALTTSGKRLSATRKYRTCTKKQARQYKGRL